MTSGIDNIAVTPEPSTLLPGIAGLAGFALTVVSAAPEHA
jgi:hypothetical protein